MPTARRISLALKSLDIVVQALARAPSSVERTDLLALAQTYRETVEQWRSRPPAAEESDRLMTRILKLHVQTAKLRRGP